MFFFRSFSVLVVELFACSLCYAIIFTGLMYSNVSSGAENHVRVGQLAHIRKYGRRTGRLNVCSLVHVIFRKFRRASAYENRFLSPYVCFYISTPLRTRAKYLIVFHSIYTVRTRIYIHLKLRHIRGIEKH